jgi:hypothetical protein
MDLVAPPAASEWVAHEVVLPELVRVEAQGQVQDLALHLARVLELARHVAQCPVPDQALDQGQGLAEDEVLDLVLRRRLWVRQMKPARKAKRT